MKTLINLSDRNEIFDRIQMVETDSPRQWGRMNPHQMICHLNDSFKTAMGERTVKSSATLVSRTLLKRFALSVPMKWPQGVKTLPEVDQEKDGTKPVDFDKDRLELEMLIGRFIRLGNNFNWPEHPMFGAMTHDDWMRWGYLHTAHHLRQFGV